MITIKIRNSTRPSKCPSEKKRRGGHGDEGGIGCIRTLPPLTARNPHPAFRLRLATARQGGHPLPISWGEGTAKLLHFL